MHHLIAPTAHEDCRARKADRRSARRGSAPEASRPRPDVSGYFAVALVSALASGFFVGADLLREEVGLDRILAFAAVHPMAYVLVGCVALMAVLLTVGDI